MRYIITIIITFLAMSCGSNSPVSDIKGTNFIKGTITDSDGNPYRSAQVYLLEKKVSVTLAKTLTIVRENYEKIDSTISNSAGYYQFVYPGEGEYRVDVYEINSVNIFSKEEFTCTGNDKELVVDIVEKIEIKTAPIDTAKVDTTSVEKDTTIDTIEADTTVVPKISRVITITGDANIFETQIISTQDTVPVGGSSWADYNYGGQTEFTTGVYDYNTRLRSLFKFDFEDSITSGMTIDSAFIVLTISEWLGQYTENDVTLYSHLLLENWDEGELAEKQVSTSSNGATSTERVHGTPWNARCVGLDDVDAQRDTSSTTFIPYGVTEVRIPIKVAITSWVGGVTNNGIVLVNENELDAGRSKIPKFHSSECDSTGVPPKIEIYITE